MSQINIFKPDISQVVKGIEGKAILLYGSNGVGKTLNATKAPKPYIICFENGLGAISNVAYSTITKWTDFLSVVKQFTAPATRDQAKEMYETIIIDGLEGLGQLCEPYVAAMYNADSVKSGNKGFGLWSEFEAELRKPIKALCSSGFTVIFLGHEAEREFPTLTMNADGEYKMKKLYPKGEKRAIDTIINECDIVGYIQAQPANELGHEVLSTVYFANNNAFIAKTRYPYLVREIKEWSYEKLEKALIAAIAKGEKVSGHKTITPKEFVDQNDAKKAADLENYSNEELIQHIGQMLLQSRDAHMKTNPDNPMIEYDEIKKAHNIAPDFKCQAATEKDTEILQMIHQDLVDKGYTWKEI